MSLSLSELQARFSQALRDRSRLCQSHFLMARKNPAISFQTRFGIYHYAYRSRIYEIVATDFPRLVKLLGKKRFNDMFDEYLKKHPSRHENISEFACKLPEFLLRYDPWRKKPWLSELARYEWALETSFLAPMKKTDPKMVEENTPLGLSRSVILFESRWAVNKLRRKSPRIDQKATKLLIYRKWGKVYVRRVRSGQWQLLCELQKSKSISALSMFLEHSRLSPRRVSEWICFWVSEGILQPHLEGSFPQAR